MCMSGNVCFSVCSQIVSDACLCSVSVCVCAQTAFDACVCVVRVSARVCGCLCACVHVCTRACVCDPTINLVTSMPWCPLTDNAVTGEEVKTSHLPSSGCRLWRGMGKGRRERGRGGEGDEGKESIG